MNVQQHSGKIIGQRSGLKVIDCTDCGYAHLEIIPSEEELLQFYHKNYYDSHKSDYIEKDLKEEKYWEISFEDRLHYLSKFTSGRKLLDVGCGSGRFIRYAKQMGWECTGIEPSRSAADVATSDGLNVICSDFNSFRKNNNESYDVVHFKNVLEHVIDPLSTLNSCNTLLNKNGVLYTEVPNDFDCFQKMCSAILKSPPVWVTHEHISYFNFCSLEKLLIKNNFNILQRDTTFPMYLFPLIGMNFLKNPSLGAKCHNYRMKIELFLYKYGLNSFKRLLYRVLANAGLGRTVIIYAQKQVYG